MSILSPPNSRNYTSNDLKFSDITKVYDTIFFIENDPRRNNSPCTGTHKSISIHFGRGKNVSLWLKLCLSGGILWILYVKKSGNRKFLLLWNGTSEITAYGYKSPSNKPPLVSKIELHEISCVKFTYLTFIWLNLWVVSMLRQFRKPLMLILNNIGDIH